MKGLKSKIVSMISFSNDEEESLILFNYESFNTTISYIAKYF